MQVVKGGQVNHLQRAVRRQVALSIERDWPIAQTEQSLEVNEEICKGRKVCL